MLINHKLRKVCPTRYHFSMLPDFPKFKAEVHRETLAKIRRRVDQADSVVSQIKRIHPGKAILSVGFGR